MKELECRELLAQYYSYLENETVVYELNTLGYPWYYVYRFHHNVNVPANEQLQRFKVNTKPSTVRYEDFISKVELLDNAYDYAFITKAKMRRNVSGQAENYIFEDVFSYLVENNKRFLIFEMPEGNELVDNKYLESKYFSKTIPFEFITSSFSHKFQEQVIQSTKEYQEQLQDCFNSIKFDEQYQKLNEYTLRTLIGFSEFIPRIITLQYIFSSMGINALIGGMGSHLSAGINNNFKIIEIAHGAYGFRDEDYRMSNSLIDYYNKNFSRQDYFSLIYSSLGTTYYDMLCPIENRYEYGIPEVRHFKNDAQKLAKIKDKYLKNKDKILLFAATHTIDPEKLANFATVLAKSIPDLAILVRLHPTFDAKSRYKESNFSIVPSEEVSLHELLSIADIVISPPSTVVFEANYFTDKVIVTPQNQPEQTIAEVSNQFPYHHVYSLDDPTLISVISNFITATKQNVMQNVDYMSNVEELFKKIVSPRNHVNSDDNMKTMIDPKITASFLEPVLTANTIDIFVVRSAILKELNNFIDDCSGVILDIGCGGMPYRSLVESNPNIERYIGLDIENPIYQKNIRPDIFWDGKRIPLPDNAIDCAFATEVFEHVPDLKTVLSEIRRVLKPDAKLFFTVPFLWPLHDTPHDEYRYTPFSLKRIFEESGFKNIDLEALGGWNASLAQMLGLWLRRAPINDATRQALTDQFFTFYQELINTDVKPHIYDDQIMITGISGTATVGAKKVMMKKMN